MKKTFLFLIFVLMAIPAFALTSGKIPVAMSTSSPGIPSATGDSDITDISGDVYTNAWADYSGSSTIVGWSSFTNKVIRYKRVGKLVFVQYYLAGTSNSTSTSFTVPYTTDTNTPSQIGLRQSVDNGGTATSGIWNITGGGISTIYFYQTAGGVGWTASGTKLVSGQFWYQST